MTGVWLPDYRNPLFSSISDADLRYKLALLDAKWREAVSAEEGRSGSPLETLDEAIAELEIELQRRAYVEPTPGNEHLGAWFVAGILLVSSFLFALG